MIEKHAQPADDSQDQNPVQATHMYQVAVGLTPGEMPPCFARSLVFHACS